MSFGAPMAFLWAALAIPIVVFYILKVRLRRAPVSTSIFWRQVYDEKRPRSLWQQLRHLLSLLLQIALLLLLVFALAEPFFTAEIKEARRLILVVDNSASMAATDVAPHRLAAAKQLGQQLISGLRFRDEMAIISAGAQPQVVCGLTGHERTLHDALETIEQADGPTLVPAAVTLGHRLLGDTKHGQVIVLSDGCFPEVEKIADDPSVQFHAVGTRAANIGLTNFQVRRSLVDPIGYEILIEVTNASDEAAKCRLELDLNDAPVDVVPLDLAAGQSWTKSIEKTSVAGGKLIASIKQPDILPADNTAIALLPARATQKVTLVTAGNWFLQKALLANPLVELSVTDMPPEKYDPAVLYIFHRKVPAEMPAVNALVIEPLESTDLWKVGEPLNNPIVTKQDNDSPLTRHVRLDNVLLPQARKIEPTGPAHPLVTAISGDPLYFSMDKNGRKILVLTVNLDEGDLTFRTAFPIMTTNALSWFAGQSGELREALSTGAVTEVLLPAADGLANAKHTYLQSPSGKRRPLPKGVTTTSIGPLDQCGIWQVLLESGEDAKSKAVKNADTKSDPPHLELACNLANRTESDLRVPKRFIENTQVASLAPPWFTRPIWFYLIATAWALAALEWYLYQRRWIS